MVKDTVFKNELVLEENLFHNFDMRTDKFACAQCIQNLLITEKGTYPNQPLLGVGIENYLFEFCTETEISKLETEIKSQINTFIDTSYDVEFEIYKSTEGGVTVLRLDFSITDNLEESETVFSLIFGKSQKTQKTISKLII